MKCAGLWSMLVFGPAVKLTPAEISERLSGRALIHHGRRVKARFKGDTKRGRQTNTFSKTKKSLFCNLRNGQIFAADLQPRSDVYHYVFEFLNAAERNCRTAPRKDLQDRVRTRSSGLGGSRPDRLESVPDVLQYRDTSLQRNDPFVGPYSTTIPTALWWP